MTDDETILNTPVALGNDQIILYIREATPAELRELLGDLRTGAEASDVRDMIAAKGYDMEVWDNTAYGGDVDVLLPSLADRPLVDQPEPPTVAQAHELYLNDDIDEGEYEAMVQAAMRVHGDGDVPTALDDSDEGVATVREVGRARTLASIGLCAVFMTAALAEWPPIVGAVAMFIVGVLWTRDAVGVAREMWGPVGDD